MGRLLLMVRAFLILVSRRGDAPAGHRADSHTHWDPDARTWRKH